MTNPEQIDPSIAADAAKMRAELGQETPPAAVQKPVEEQKPDTAVAVVEPVKTQEVVSAEDYCVRRIQRLKNTAGFLICTFREISIPDEPEIQKALKLGFDAEDAIRANASWLKAELDANAPDGKIDLLIALSLDVWLTWKTIGRVAAARKPAEDAPPAA